MADTEAVARDATNNSSTANAAAGPAATRAIVPKTATADVASRERAARGAETTMASRHSRTEGKAAALSEPPRAHGRHPSERREKSRRGKGF